MLCLRSERGRWATCRATASVRPRLVSPGGSEPAQKDRERQRKIVNKREITIDRADRVFIMSRFQPQFLDNIPINFYL